MVFMATSAYPAVCKILTVWSDLYGLWSVFLLYSLFYFTKYGNLINMADIFIFIGIMQILYSTRQGHTFV